MPVPPMLVASVEEEERMPVEPSSAMPAPKELNLTVLVAKSVPKKGEEEALK